MKISDNYRLFAMKLRRMGKKKQADDLENSAAVQEAKETLDEMKDYCEIGLVICPVCGYQHPYKVSGCRRCYRSFVE